MDGGKSIVINANETVQDMSGKSLEQWLLRVCVMYLLFGEKAMGMILMAYALIPDGYSLKKVTKLQKDAVDAKRRHDDVVALLNNENTPIVFGVPIIAFISGVIAKSAAEAALDAAGVVAEKTRETAVGAVAGTKFSLDIFGQLLKEGKVFVEGAPKTITLEEILAFGGLPPI